MLFILWTDAKSHDFPGPMNDICYLSDFSILLNHSIYFPYDIPAPNTPRVLPLSTISFPYHIKGVHNFCDFPVLSYQGHVMTL